MLPEGRSFELSEELLQGAIDVHVHATPHLPSSPRRIDPIQAAIQARDAGMQTIVLMDVFQMTNGVAWIVNRAVPDYKVYGGLILNTAYGGLNPRAVKTAIRYGDGAKFISFGTHSTYFQASREGRVVDGKFSPLSELYPEFKKEEVERAISIPTEGPVGPELDEILGLIAANPHIFLNTGHVSGEEAVRLVDLAGEYGIKDVLVATGATKAASLDQLKYMAGKRERSSNTLWPLIPIPHPFQRPTTTLSLNMQLWMRDYQKRLAAASGGLPKRSKILELIIAS